MNNRVLIGLITLCVSQISLANNLLDFRPTVLSVNLGPAWTSSGYSQTITLLPNVMNRYVSSDQTHSFFNGELFVGWKKSWTDAYLTHLGLAVDVTNSLRLNGAVWQMANPLFDNELYSYKVNHTHVAFKGKIIDQSFQSISPYLFGSLGVGFNRAYGYNNTPTITSVIASPNFTQNTQTAFTYTVGTGFQRHLTKTFTIGIEYEFGDWGKSQLSSAPYQTIGNGLSLQHMYYNGFNVNLTWS